MKKTTLITVAVLSAMSLSCDKSSAPGFEQLPTQETIQEKSTQLTSDELQALFNQMNGTRVSEQDATQSALSVMNFLDESKATKSATGRSIQSMKPVTGPAKLTKAGDSISSDTLAYVFNFSNNEGYTIISADSRTDAVFALVPEGNIDFDQEIDDDIFQSGVIVFYDNLSAMYESQIQKSARTQDSLVNAALAKLAQDSSYVGTRASGDDVQVTYGPVQLLRAIGPLIPVRWGQNNPYNLSTPIINGEHAYTGCGATATAQLMAYWRYPASYNWDLMMPPSANETLATFQAISDLMYNVGVGINTRYQAGHQSPSYFSDIYLYLNNLGYNIGNYTSYNDDDVFESLDESRPVLITGCTHKHDVYQKRLIFWKKYSHTYYTGGHIWIIDGLAMTYRYMYISINGIVVSKTMMPIATLVHCNFGWHEKNYDGYYNPGTFNTSTGPVTRASTTEEVSGSDGYYQYEVEIMSNIYK